MAQAHYLAESAVQHAMYICVTNPSQLAATSATSMLGPYKADSTADTYSFYGTPNLLNVGQWTLVGVGTSGGVQQKVTVTVFRTGGADFTSGQALASSSSVTLTGSVAVTGNMAVHGNVTNQGTVNGLVTYTGSFLNQGGHTTQNPVRVSSVNTPILLYAGYSQYKLYSKTYKRADDQCVLFRSGHRAQQHRGGDDQSRRGPGRQWQRGDPE